MEFLFLCVCQLNIVTETIRNASKIATIEFYLPFLDFITKETWKLLKLKFGATIYKKGKADLKLMKPAFSALRFNIVLRELALFYLKDLKDDFREKKSLKSIGTTSFSFLLGG